MEKKDFRKAVDEQLNPTITEEDKNTKASSLRNYLVDTLGLPDQWSQSQADVKQFDAGLPMQMGMASMGSIGKVTSTPRMAQAIMSPSIKNIAAAEGTHAIEKIAAEDALQRLASEGVEKGTALFKDLFSTYKAQGMK